MGAKAAGNIVRAQGKMQLAKGTGINREGLYKALGEQGSPSFAAVVKVCMRLGCSSVWGARSVQS